MKTTPVRFNDRVAEALRNRAAVVALESTVIAHGLPAPLNLETARACEDTVGRAGATPATIGIVEGRLAAGLSEEELAAFAGSSAAGGRRIEKVGLNNLAGVLARRGWGATTVAGTLMIAHLAGLRVFSTGGIGGVHRGAAESLDISADLTALARYPLVCVSAGAKAVLDLAKTLEKLETLGVPVIGFRTREFPAFYSRKSGLGLDLVVESAEEAARIAACHWQTGSTTAVVIAVPVPEEFELPFDQVERACLVALEEAAREGVRGKAITPFLLSRLEKLTHGDTLEANRALLINNASVAAEIALSLARLDSL
ncbi:MAG TPA: pseudouridine-5'-phosphate glycosidase [Blastocatellia bacterium]|nr:pseudouridine-5'-phosphate glycosidase [Blastocatellia bacterium]